MLADGRPSSNQKLLIDHPTTGAPEHFRDMLNPSQSDFKSATRQGIFLKKRTRTEIIVEILNLCRKPQPKTRLLQKTNLSWQLGTRYLDNMLSLGLIEIHHSPTKYTTTQKGNKLLDRWKALAETIQALNRF